MNANELAVYLEDITDSEKSPYRQAATMLRQQQAEILAGKIMIKGYGKTIDEQQAEIEVLKKQCALLQEGYNAQSILLGVETGLTPDTHPAELTDEEITAISKEIFKDYKNFHHYQIEFARAILRKAQEK